MRLDSLPLWNHAASIENETAGAINTAPASNMTSTKSLTCRKTVIGKEATSRRSMNCLGLMRPRTMRRSLGREASPILSRYPAVPAPTAPDGAVGARHSLAPLDGRQRRSDGDNSAAPERRAPFVSASSAKRSRHWISRAWCGRLPRYRAGDVRSTDYRPPSIRRQAVGPQWCNFWVRQCGRCGRSRPDVFWRGR
jgi:hypothetical protein